jgi:hypothetical protein
MLLPYIDVHLVADEPGVGRDSSFAANFPDGKDPPAQGDLKFFERLRETSCRRRLRRSEAKRERKVRQVNSLAVETIEDLM